MVFSAKLRTDGSLSKLKTRYCPRGYEDVRFQNESAILKGLGKVGARRKDSPTVEDVSIMLGLSAMLDGPRKTGLKWDPIG